MKGLNFYLNFTIASQIEYPTEEPCPLVTCALHFLLAVTVYCIVSDSQGQRHYVFGLSVRPSVFLVNEISQECFEGFFFQTLHVFTVTQG